MLHVTSHVRGYSNLRDYFMKFYSFILTVNGQVLNRIIQIIDLYIFFAIFEQLKQLPMCRFPGSGGSCQLKLSQHSGCVRSDIDNFCHISTEIWQRLSSLFSFSRAFSAFPVFPPFPFSAFPFFPPFPLFRGCLKNKSLCGGERFKPKLAVPCHIFNI